MVLDRTYQKVHHILYFYIKYNNFYISCLERYPKFTLKYLVPHIILLKIMKFLTNIYNVVQLRMVGRSSGLNEKKATDATATRHGRSPPAYSPLMSDHASHPLLHMDLAAPELTAASKL
jgi:hypothetical protein